MARKLRFLDDRCLFAGQDGPLTVWDITTPVIDGLCLFAPGVDLARIVLGVLAAAQRKWRFEIYAFSFMSTHWHLQAGFVDLTDKADVMCFINGNIARKVNGLRGRSGPLFERRNTAIQVLNDAECLDRFAYILGQGTQAFVVRHPEEDPFVSANPALLRGERLLGEWAGEPCEVRLSRLPVLRDLDDDAHRAQLWALADDIARGCRVRRKKAGRRLQGAESARRLDPFTRIKVRENTPAPVVHGTKAQEAAWRIAYASARTAYTAARIAFQAWLSDPESPLLRWPPCTLPPAWPRAPRIDGTAAREGP
ncbi:MAG: hypothetical protein H6706_14815 [Myxococcales bacterium]|nr:hypothetical protein [Myxococcales bacterium]